MDALERANALLDTYAAVALSELPPGIEVFDAHTHVGLDIDGMTGDADELLAIQRSYGIARSFVFCLDEPDRHPAFSAANDRTLACAADSGGALLPFVRLDLNESPARGGRALPRAGCARDQAPPSGARVPAGRPAARAGLRARSGAPRARS